MIVISGIIEEDAEIIPAVDVGQGGGSPIASVAGGSTQPAVVTNPPLLLLLEVRLCCLLYLTTPPHFPAQFLHQRLSLYPVIQVCNI